MSTKNWKISATYVSYIQILYYQGHMFEGNDKISKKCFVASSRSQCLAVEFTLLDLPDEWFVGGYIL